jgi:hypothetical protein
MNRITLRIMFVALVCFLFLQFLYALKFSEPYPAIKLPGFGKIPQLSGQIDYTKYELLLYPAEGDSMVVNAEDLLENYPKTYIPGILTTIISKHNPTKADKQTNLSNSLLQDYTQFKVWLNDRLYTMYNKRFYKMVINKREFKRSIDTPDSQAASRLLERAEIILSI